MFGLTAWKLGHGEGRVGQVDSGLPPSGWNFSCLLSGHYPEFAGVAGYHSLSYDCGGLRMFEVAQTLHVILMDLTGSRFYKNIGGP